MERGIYHIIRHIGLRGREGQVELWLDLYRIHGQQGGIDRARLPDVISVLAAGLAVFSIDLCFDAKGSIAPTGSRGGDLWPAM